MFVFNDTISFPDHSFLQYFSSPFDEDSSLLDLQQQQQPQNDINLLHHLPLNELIPSTFANNLGSESRKIGVTKDHDDHIQISKRGSCKRDRHSKIDTLRGPRDRRMRLSLPVAKEFFGLQDMLGFDKASKTVEWLLFQARHAIKKLSRDQKISFPDGNGGDTRSPSSLVSDGEVVSGIDETTTFVINRGTKEDRKATRKEKRGRVARKAAFHPMARECREKARARARARTREKQLQVLQNPIEQIEGTTTTTRNTTPKLQDLSQISSSWSTQMEIISNGEELSRTRNNQGIIDDDDDDQEDDHDCLMIMEKWSPSNSIYNSLQNNNGSPQEHPFGDFQFLGKPWEPYNNHGIC